MARIISITNQKGGVAKSTTAYALAAALHNENYKVLLIDMDAQGNLTDTILADNISSNMITTYDVLLKSAPIGDSIIKSDKCDLIPASLELSGADMELTAVGKEHRLRKALEPIKENYDFIIIDTPPALGVLTINALTAADEVLIPAQADVYSLQGIGQLYNTVQAVKEYCNAKIKIAGILLTRYNGRTKISKNVFEMTRQTAQQIGTKMFNTVIRECTVIKEAQAENKDLFTFAKNSNAAEDYMKFTKEFLEGEKNE